MERHFSSSSFWTRNFYFWTIENYAVITIWVMPVNHSNCRKNLTLKILRRKSIIYIYETTSNTPLKSFISIILMCINGKILDMVFLYLFSLYHSLCTFLRCPDVSVGVWSRKGLLSHFDKKLPILYIFQYTLTM